MGKNAFTNRGELARAAEKRCGEYISAVGMLKDAGVYEQLAEAIEKTAGVFRNNGSLYVCGNGGSSADAQHFAGELLNTSGLQGVRFRALHLGDIYSTTATLNDFSDDEIFERQLRALGSRGDIIYGISTSGKAVNIHRALDAAKEMGIYRVGIVGNGDLSKEIVSRSDTAIIIPSADTQIIQQTYFALFHYIWLGLIDIFKEERA